MSTEKESGPRKPHTKLETVQRLAGQNCEVPDLYWADAKNRERCPNCGQFHLRAGYCQALDPDSSWHESRLGKLHKAKGV